MSRYIDANKLEETITDNFLNPYERSHIHDLIDNQPTADVQEVKHGKWIVRHRRKRYVDGQPYVYDENVCPFCKRTDHNGDGVFCGYCGAKMDGE